MTLKPDENTNNSIDIRINNGLSDVVRFLTLLWWFSGIAIAPGFWWKAASLIPPVGMVIAIDRVITELTPLK